MTKVFLQPGLRGLSGAMGDWVYQMRNGKTILGMKPINSKEPSQAQVTHRERFKQATLYGKLVMADPALHAFYTQAAAQKDVPIFALCVADFFHTPTINEVDTSDYNGHEGSPIHITALDDVGVVSVRVTITDNNGIVLESGNAIETSSGSGRWSYITTTFIGPDFPVNINVVAMDRPGGTAVQDMPLTIS